MLLPPIVALLPREEHLRLDADQARCHLQILGGLVQLERMHPVDELLTDAGDRDVVDVELLVADQREEEVEWAVEPLDVDDERALEGRQRRCGHRGKVDPSRSRVKALRGLDVTPCRA